MTASPSPSEGEVLVPERNIGCWELFLAFGGVGLCGFGGVMPWTYRMLVEKRRWLNPEEFANMLSLCQFLPGGNAMNMAICVGSRFAGLRGAIVAFVGLMAMPIAIVLALATAYQSYGRIEAVEAAFHGVSSAAAGLILAMGLISLMTIGGGFSALPEMHRVVVDVYGWMSSETFANLFALAQAAPGPNLIVVALLGWQVAGISGALVAAGAICIPAFVIVYVASRLTTRWNHLPWYKVFERGLLPVTMGLIVASACLLGIAAAGPRWGGYAVTALTAAGVLWTRLNPLVLLGIAALAGVLNLV